MSDHRMGEAEKLLPQPSAPSRDLDWRSPVPVRKISEILPVPQDDSFVRHIPLTQGRVAIVDTADFEWLNQWKWYAVFARKRGCWYAARKEASGTKNWKMVRMHRVLLEAPEGVEVDHKDGDGLNNKRLNIRLATGSQNRANTGPHRNNKSGCKGVHWVRRNKKWKAQITSGGKVIYLGLFSSKAAAAQAYKVAAEKLHGKFARTESFQRSAHGKTEV